MKMMLSFSVLLLVLLSCGKPAESRTLLLDSCSVNAHLQELQKHYSDIRSAAVSGDSEIGVKILDKSLIKNVQEGQTCCFIRLVLRFYVERVFGNYASSEPQHQRLSSALANAFVTIRKEIHDCRCLCAEDTQRKIDSVQAEFDKLTVSQAAKKAVGELDTVLNWMEGLRKKESSS